MAVKTEYASVKTAQMILKRSRAVKTGKSNAIIQKK